MKLNFCVDGSKLYKYLKIDASYSRYIGSNSRTDRVDIISYLPSKSKIHTDKFKYLNSLAPKFMNEYNKDFLIHTRAHAHTHIHTHARARVHTHTHTLTEKISRISCRTSSVKVWYFLCALYILCDTTFDILHFVIDNCSFF